MARRFKRGLRPPHYMVAPGGYWGVAVRTGGDEDFYRRMGYRRVSRWRFFRTFREIAQRNREG